MTVHNSLTKEIKLGRTPVNARREVARESCLLLRMRRVNPICTNFQQKQSQLN